MCDNDFQCAPSQECSIILSVSKYFNIDCTVLFKMTKGVPDKLLSKIYFLNVHLKLNLHKCFNF